MTDITEQLRTGRDPETPNSVPVNWIMVKGADEPERLLAALDCARRTDARARL